MEFQNRSNKLSVEFISMIICECFKRRQIEVNIFHYIHRYLLIRLFTYYTEEHISPLQLCHLVKTSHDHLCFLSWYCTVIGSQCNPLAVTVMYIFMFSLHRKDKCLRAATLCHCQISHAKQRVGISRSSVELHLGGHICLGLSLSCQLVTLSRRCFLIFCCFDLFFFILSWK